MAVVSPMKATIHEDSPTSHAEASTILISTRREIVEEPMTPVCEEIIYVAVGKNVKECESIFKYVKKFLGGKKICLLHVHVPAQMIPLMGTRFPANSLKKAEVRAYREIEKQSMLRVMNEYILICLQAGITAEKLYAEAESIEKGIVDLISMHGIKRLVMGAAADKCYSRRMVDLRSRKAIHVRLRAPVFCHIEFICKGNLICTREGSATAHGAQVELTVSSPQRSPDFGAPEIANWRSRSLPMGQVNSSVVGSPASDLPLRGRSLHVDYFRGSVLDPSSPNIMNPANKLDVKETCDGWGLLSRRSNSELSDDPTHSPSGVNDMASNPLSRVQESENGLEDGKTDWLYNEYERMMMESANARREAFLESIRCRKSEKETTDALRRVKAAEGLYAEELKRRKEIEEELAKEKATLATIKNQRNQEKEELRIAQDQKASLERQLLESDLTVKELEQKIISAVDLLQSYKREREDLQIQRDSALREAEELRKALEISCPHIPQFFSEFPFWEVEKATKNFDPSLKIGEGGYGSIYKGFLRQTAVAIKILHSDSSQGPSEFLQEVNVLSMMRHPNLVTLIGACPEAWILIYEYLCNGSLEDRLNCKDNTPPLSWQVRIRIATELCSALMFLHSSKPHSIVHGDLKPANVLLDANYVCKLGDFGICRLLSRNEMLSDSDTLVCRTENPKGTFAYMDPEFLSTGELTTKSDVYSFGIIVLRLLTGRSAMGLSKEVQYAMVNGKLKSILDTLAGDWPFVQAEQLARLALRCCDVNRKSRPDLITDVWRVLEPMRASCGALFSVQLGSAKQWQPPYFICPIFQEVMRDPHVAADGFTYEAEAIRGWLDSGNDTSPMTNLKLDHRNLVPNRALRSTIQEWLQRN